MDWNPVINAILSFIIPGLGQAINGDKKKGIIMFVIAVIFVAIRMWIYPGIVMEIIYLIYRAYAAYDAYTTY